MVSRNGLPPTIDMNDKIYKLILGAVDAPTAKISHLAGADFIWASSLILSAMMGKKDDGITDTKRFDYSIKAISKGSKSIIFDFDIGGRNFSELGRNLKHLSSNGVHGVCIEDEPYPKVNAMISSERKLIDPVDMAKKIRFIKTKNLVPFVIARTHSLIVGESLSRLQDRIFAYENAGADALAIHYTAKNWQKYSDILAELKYSKPLVVILSKEQSLPEEINQISGVEYIVFPNQLYREMTGRIMHISKQKIFEGSCWNDLITTDELFNLIENLDSDESETK